MPLDNQGKFQLNNQKVRHANSMHSMDTGGQSAGAPTTADKGAAEHPDIVSHLKDMHAQHGGKHMHVHSHDGGVMTHHTNAQGEVEGPHQHGSMDEASEHMKSAMGEDGEAPLDASGDEGAGDNDSGWD